MKLNKCKKILPDNHGGIRRDDTAQGKVGEPGSPDDSSTYNPQPPQEEIPQEQQPEQEV